MFLAFLEAVLGVMVTPKSRSFDSAEVRFAQDDSSIYDCSISGMKFSSYGSELSRITPNHNSLRVIVCRSLRLIFEGFVGIGGMGRNGTRVVLDLLL
jgi:hypothetical protein